MLEILFNGLLIHSLVLSSYLAFTLPWRLLEITLLVVHHLTFLKGFSSQNTWGRNSFMSKHFKYWRKFPNILGVEGNVYKLLLLYCQLIYLCGSHNIICCHQEWYHSDQEWYHSDQEWYNSDQEWYHSHQEWYHSDQEWYHSDRKSCTTLVTRMISSPLKVISLLSQGWYHHY